ncbi:ATP-dependent DNA helicase DinG [Brevibacillus humidisoli]|uniref:ATP-dependent DNA helicase DinG n=1 Tax=Brevibacillus humidisoli TaxID=2895522 RepID=UPI001E59D565|nr:ATP-dependent DNA helicase DinG [Brevibacillus humidisoli]UFJ42743.1 ATP-dependent DNA helicase DinG [Brevibacillus humidisoli]
MKRFIVIDFETTGNQPRQGDKIIQIGAVAIDDGIITDHFSTFVHPGGPIPPMITSLTGITDEMVADAPTLEEVLPQLLRLLDKRTFVAHNASFDLSFLQEALLSQGYYTFDGYVLDTVELARFLFPTQGSYRLVELADDFDIQHDHPHQADSDALATAQLFLRMLQFLHELPLVTIQRLQILVTSFRSDLGALLRSIEMEKLSENPLEQEPNEPASPEADGWDIYRQFALRSRSKLERQPQAIERSTFELDVFLERLLAEDGLIAQIQPGYERRQAQEAMIRGIYEAMNDGEHLLVEAGTGTGKTMGYLIPAILWSKWHDQQVVISTHTIHLQDQLFQKDLPVLQQALPFSFTASLLKGRGNYLCLRKMEQQLAETTEADTHELQLTKAQLVSWLTQTETGDVEELSLSPVGSMLWQQVKSDVHSCLHRHCPWFSRCYYFRARELAKEADLLIVNHALLINDLEAENRILPTYDVAILDEAHQLEEVASQHLGAQYTTARLYQLLDRLSTKEEHDLLNRLVEEVAQSTPMLATELHNHLHSLGQLSASSRDSLQQWSGRLYNWAARRSGEQTEAGRATVRYRQDTFVGKGERLLSDTRQLVQALVTQGQELERLLTLVKERAESTPFALKSLLTDAEGLVDDLRTAADTLYFLLLDGPPEYVFWMEIETRSPRKHVSLFAAPLDVSSVLARKLFAEKRSITLTSATLTVKNSFRYYIERHGLEESGRYRTLTLPSPFAYEQQGLILLPDDFPALGKDSEETYLDAVIQGCVDVVRAAKGRTLILFTSYTMLRCVYDAMKEALDGEGYDLLGHGIDSNNRSKLVRKFQRQQKSVLLGTSSFWEGVDIPGDVLSCVIIVRLPFQPPNQPLLEGRSEKAKEEKKNPFLSLSLPHAVIRFKQGLGRLIRHHTDRGVIVVFDSRIVESRYGKAFLASLPPYRVESGAWVKLRDRIASFLEGMQADELS